MSKLRSTICRLIHIQVERKFLTFNLWVFSMIQRINNQNLKRRKRKRRKRGGKQKKPSVYVWFRTLGFLVSQGLCRRQMCGWRQNWTQAKRKSLFSELSRRCLLLSLSHSPALSIPTSDSQYLQHILCIISFRPTLFK